MQTLIPCTAVLFLLTTVGAQTQGSYTIYSSGCVGTVTTSCPNANGGQTSGAVTIQNTNIFAMEGVTSRLEIVSGVQLLTASTSTSTIQVNVQLLERSPNGGPNSSKVIASGVMSVTPAGGWTLAKFARPVILRPNQKFFVTYVSTRSMRWPWATTGVRGAYYWHPPTQTAWRGPFFTQRWAWRLVCATATGLAMPTICGEGAYASTNMNGGAPRINAPFNIRLIHGKANSTAILIIGASNTLWGQTKLPLDLSRYGAPTCQLLASLDVLLFMKTDANGSATMAATLPNNSKLVGVTVYNQWAVADPSANAWGMVFSAGAILKVGG